MERVHLIIVGMVQEMLSLGGVVTASAYTPICIKEKFIIVFVCRYVITNVVRRAIGSDECFESGY